MVEPNGLEIAKDLKWNLSYDGNYHAKHYDSGLVYARIKQQHSACTAQSADTGTKIASTGKTQSAKMSASDGARISQDATTSPVEDGMLPVSSIGGLSDTDTAFSEESTEPAEVGDGRYSDFSPPPHSDADSTYNSDRSSVSTLGEGEENVIFHLEPREEGVALRGEGADSNAAVSDGRKKKPDISLLLDPPPAVLKMNAADGRFHVNGPVDMPENASDGLYEDREFDFLKTEPVRRSTSLKTYKTPPGTPHRKKAVRFADVLGLDLESVRHILNLEEPPTVPLSAMKDLKVGLEEEHRTEGARYLTACFSQPGAAPNFLKTVAEEKVVLESCLVDDKDLTISGSVRVANIAFHKKVIVRYTVNNWLTFEDVCASYVQNSNDGPTDRFSFSITVPSYFSVGSKLMFAVMFTAGAQTFWDSNGGGNYMVECYARAVPLNETDHAWMHFL